MRKASDLLTIAEQHEPGAVWLAGELVERGLGRAVRAYQVVDHDGSVLGVVVVGRTCRDRWYAAPLVFDDRAAPLLGEAIDRSPTREVDGLRRHVEPLLPYLQRRTREPHTMSFGALDIMPALPTDERSRCAEPADIDALVDLYAEFELEVAPTRVRLRALLRRALAAGRPIAVIEEDGRIVAAARCEFRSNRYDFWSALTVHPGHRGRGLYDVLRMEIIGLSHAAGQGSCGTLAPTNPMDVDNHLRRTPMDGVVVDEWMVVPLRLHERFPGHRYARRAVQVLEGALQKRSRDTGLAPTSQG